MEASEVLPSFELVLKSKPKCKLGLVQDVLSSCSQKVRRLIVYTRGRPKDSRVASGPTRSRPPTVDRSRRYSESASADGALKVVASVLRLVARYVS